MTSLDIMKLENLAYIFFGNNLVVGGHIRKQLAFLREVVPPAFLNREVDDLGCGDGKVTVLLRDILKPSRMRGFDLYPGLIRRAACRGVEAEICDLNKDMPQGELGVVWGVLHHLKDFDIFLDKLKENYPLIFIREPVRTGLIKGLELGHPMRPDVLLELINRCLPGSEIHQRSDSVLVFYARPGYLK